MQLLFPKLPQSLLYSRLYGRFSYGHAVTYITYTALLLLVLIQPVWAQAIDQHEEFKSRYAEVIQSEEQADQALAGAAKEKEAVEDRYVDQQRACYQKFFVSHCLGNAADEHRLDLKDVHAVEVRAKAYKRQETADERDKALLEQNKKYNEDAVGREQEQKEKEADSAKKMEESARRAQAAQQKESAVEGKPDPRVVQHEAKVRAQQAEDAARAPERAANEAKYAAKVKAAEEHKREVDARIAEKARKRAEKGATEKGATETAPDAPENNVPAGAK